MSIAVTIVIVNWLLLLIDEIPPLYDYDELKWSSKFSVPPQLQLHIYIYSYVYQSISIAVTLLLALHYIT